MGGREGCSLCRGSTRRMPCCVGSEGTDKSGNTYVFGLVVDMYDGFIAIDYTLSVRKNGAAGR